jgi:predicted metal-dependent HD superfamily phosphohydrolase
VFTNSFETLKLHWKTLLQQFMVEAMLSEKVFLDLVIAYSSAGRVYHTLNHIQQVLKTIEQMRSLTLNLPTIQLAAWFHDVIYDSITKDNEEKSAEYAEVVLNSLKIPKTIIAQVKNLILYTKTHQAPAADIDSQILLDADLAIFGSTESEYRDYAHAIRQEYSWVSDAEYRFRRKQVLQNFLQRKKNILNPIFICKIRGKS